MSKKLINIMLLVSLAFNLAVVAAFIYMTIRGPGHHRPERDRARMESFHRNHRRDSWADSDSIRALRTKFRQSKEQFMTELGKDPIQETQLNTILERSLVEQSVLERELGQRLIQHRKEMTAEEAEEFFTRRAERIRRRSERIDRLNRGFREGEEPRFNDRERGDDDSGLDRRPRRSRRY